MCREGLIASMRVMNCRFLSLSRSWAHDHEFFSTPPPVIKRRDKERGKSLVNVLDEYSIRRSEYRWAQQQSVTFNVCGWGERCSKPSTWSGNNCFVVHFKLITEDVCVITCRFRLKTYDWHLETSREAVITLLIDDLFQLSTTKFCFKVALQQQQQTKLQKVSWNLILESIVALPLDVGWK